MGKYGNTTKALHEPLQIQGDEMRRNSERTTGPAQIRQDSVAAVHTGQGTSVTVDIVKLFAELDKFMDGDFTEATDQELYDFVLEVTIKLYKLVYNALDYANKRMDIINLSALQYINDVRKKKVTYSANTLNDHDSRGPLVYSVVSKLDVIDSYMGSNLLLAIKQSAR